MTEHVEHTYMHEDLLSRIHEDMEELLRKYRVDVDTLDHADQHYDRCDDTCPAALVVRDVHEGSHHEGPLVYTDLLEEIDLEKLNTSIDCGS